MSNREFFVQMCTTEFPRFLGVLQAAPENSLEFRPHPRSRSAMELIGHMIGHEQDLVELATAGEINHRIQVPISGLAEGLQIYRDAHEAAMTALSTLDDAAWEAMAPFMVQGNVVMTAPRRDLAWMLLMDAVHHRGQLSTYLRPMGGTVPSIYGPSADTMMAQA